MASITSEKQTVKLANRASTKPRRGTVSLANWLSMKPRRGAPKPRYSPRPYAALKAEKGKLRPYRLARTARAPAAFYDPKAPSEPEPEGSILDRIENPEYKMAPFKLPKFVAIEKELVKVGEGIEKVALESEGNN